jgi:hypothetical protein
MQLQTVGELVQICLRTRIFYDEHTNDDIMQSAWLVR